MAEVQPERLPRLTQEQAEDVATRRRIKEVRGAAQLFDRAHRANICA
ncbi:MAG TPA: hypothetical protein VIK45_10665 [Candidatus Dormibacteraeota bacterium]|jgi:hypothetical protein